MTWKKYDDLRSVRRIRYEGRELLGKQVILTEKRDGENVSVWLVENDEVQIASHGRSIADSSIQTRMRATPEFKRVSDLLLSEKNDYGNTYILYGELLKRVSPTRVEPIRKHIHWILFDIWDCEEERYLGYNYIFQKAKHFKIPITRAVSEITPMTMEELWTEIKNALKWCRRHRREGVVGKAYKEQIFFKEKIDLPTIKRSVSKHKSPQLPLMPGDRCLRALQHAFDEVGEENWMDVKIAMPIVAKHMAIEAREHNYSTPRNMYKLYLETTLERLRGDV